MKNKKGFTLVELIVVIVILGILAVIAVPAYNSYTEKAKINKEQTAVSAAYSIAYAAASENFAEDKYVAGVGTSGNAKVSCEVTKNDGVGTCTASGASSTLTLNYSWTLADGVVTKD